MIYISDILHYYFGARYRFTFSNGEVVEDKLSVISNHRTLFYCGDDPNMDWWIDDYKKDGTLKLFLIHPLDMTEEQKAEYHSLCHTFKNYDGKIGRVDTPLSLHFLFKNSIDAFDLIDNGFAIPIKVETRPQAKTVKTKRPAKRIKKEASPVITKRIFTEKELGLL